MGSFGGITSLRSCRGAVAGCPSLGIGALNHKLVPPFPGKMALVLTTTPKGAAASVRVDVFVRADNRIVGFVAWTLAPLLKPRVEYRVHANAIDMGAILKDGGTAPQNAAGMLKKDDAAALLMLVQAPPAKR